MNPYTRPGERRQRAASNRFMERALSLLLVTAACGTQTKPERHGADPLDTIYAAPMAGSEYFLDEGYHLNYYSPETNAWNRRATSFICVEAISYQSFVLSQWGPGDRYTKAKASKGALQRERWSAVDCVRSCRS